MLKRVLRRLYGGYSLTMFVVVILLVFCPLLIVAPTLSLRRRVGRLAVRAWLKTCFVPFRVSGLEHVPEQPCVAICNHASYVDGIVLTAALPGRFTFLVQHGAATWPYVGLIIRRMGVRFVNRQSRLPAAHAALQLIDRVRAGESMAIFPEGTFVKEPALQPFFLGAFMVASESGVPIVPVVIRGSRRFFGDSQLAPQWSSIDIRVFPAIPPDGCDRAAANRLRDAACSLVLEHCGEADRTKPNPERHDECHSDEGGTRTGSAFV